MWDELGRRQFEFLVSAGLRPEHYLLDIGCGSFRGGRHFISYLDTGRYFGVDRNAELLQAGQEFELGPRMIAQNEPTIAQMADFAFERFGQNFDYALAQSVFTHLRLNGIRRCLAAVEKVLTQHGRFYATFFENTGGKRHLAPIEHEPGGVTTYSDRNPFHYDLETLADICEGTGLQLEYIGDWGHPKDQKMLLFTPG
jgi:SAM-dependent methyltransferase